MKNRTQLSVQALQWCNDTLKVLDQRNLPKQIHYDYYQDAAGIANAIASMRVRGAPAIGIAAAYGVYLSVLRHFSEKQENWRDLVQNDIEILKKSRPTAVNLFWAIEQMQQQLDEDISNPVPGLLNRAKQIHQQDIDANMRMGELGAELLNGVQGVLTHCNAGALATGGYGTALGVIRSASKRGLKRVYATETRPWQQGARLTVWELQEDGIPATLIADSAAAWLMKTGKIEWVIVGADRIAANGDVANKIGTYALAVLARQHKVNFMVAAPTSTIDNKMPSGDGIEIEHRNPDELLDSVFLQEKSLVQSWNPVFDVTPAELITAIVTEKGVVMNPVEKGVRSLLT